MPDKKHDLPYRWDKTRCGKKRYNKLCAQYDERIKVALQNGAAIETLQNNLATNIAGTLTKIADLKAFLQDLRYTEEALFRFLNPTPVLISDPGITREAEPVHFMHKDDLKMLMWEKQISLGELARASGRKYNSIRNYRKGLNPVPRDVADIVRGWAQK